MLEAQIGSIRSPKEQQQQLINDTYKIAHEFLPRVGLSEENTYLLLHVVNPTAHIHQIKDPKIKACALFGASFHADDWRMESGASVVLHVDGVARITNEWIGAGHVQCTQEDVDVITVASYTHDVIERCIKKKMRYSYHNLWFDLMKLGLSYDDARAVATITQVLTPEVMGVGGYEPSPLYHHLS